MKKPAKESDDESSVKNLQPIDIKNAKKNEVGGLNFKKTKLRLKKEDRSDRRVERDRIKRKHKETRLKNKKDTQQMVNVSCSV